MNRIYTPVSALCLLLLATQVNVLCMEQPQVLALQQTLPVSDAAEKSPTSLKKSVSFDKRAPNAQEQELLQPAVHAPLAITPEKNITDLSNKVDEQHKKILEILGYHSLALLELKQSVEQHVKHSKPKKSSLIEPIEKVAAVNSLDTVTNQQPISLIKEQTTQEVRDQNALLSDRKIPQAYKAALGNFDANHNNPTPNAILLTGSKREQLAALANYLCHCPRVVVDCSQVANQPEQALTSDIDALISKVANPQNKVNIFFKDITQDAFNKLHVKDIIAKATQGNTVLITATSASIINGLNSEFAHVFKANNNIWCFKTPQTRISQGSTQQ